MTNDQSITFLFPKPRRRRLLKSHVFVNANETVNAKDIVCTLQFLDANDMEVPFSLRGYTYSDRLKAIYAYLPEKADADGLRSLPIFGYPPTAAYIQIRLVKWNPTSDIDMNSLRFLTSHFLPDFDGMIFQEEKSLQQGLPNND